MSKPAFIMGIVIMGGLMGCGPSSSSWTELSAATWHEGEDFVEVPAGLAQNTAEKPLASARRALWANAFGKKGRTVRWTIEVPQPIADGQVIFRYARDGTGSPRWPTRMRRSR